MSFVNAICAAPVSGPRVLAVRPQMQARRQFMAAPQRHARTVRVQRVMCRAVESSKVLDDVRSIIADQLGKDVGEVSAESKFADLGADSLDTVEIMMALEEKFELTLEEEGAEKISTVQDAADLIAAQVK